MASRPELQAKLEELLGSRNVYFQPPESVKIQYPAIVYDLSDVNRLNANDKVYLRRSSYMVTLITKSPDSPLPEILENGLEYWNFSRMYKADNLYHFVYTVYF